MHYKIYFILAHKKPYQVQELIDLLDDEKSMFFIHIEKKVDITSFKKICNENVLFLEKRFKCGWGSFNLVKATLSGFEEISAYMKRKEPSSTYHILLLSGEDLPLKSNNDISVFLEKNITKSFIKYWKLPYEGWYKGGLFRLENVYYFNYLKYPTLNYKINRLIKKLGIKSLKPAEKLKKSQPHLHFYGGTQWMIISQDLTDFIVQISTKNIKFLNNFKYSLAPDEIYFQTLVNNFVHNLEIENTATHLVKFNSHKPHPEYLTVKDLQEANLDEFIFARKFDQNENADTIKFILNSIL
ncbi:beta-1,6-N-acetylglucosaminyltransferase [Leeuwenhoekiella sp. A16]|uniref:beta-1,6-N-acetylglucosaminyltransferase n=1 Tax=Leeuwenhoekiella sp. A16 TaxID=3141462 RepID=UPI003A80B58C